jgi:hypothetical protein
MLVATATAATGDGLSEAFVANGSAEGWMGRRGECWERHSRRQVPPHQPARRGFVRGVSLSVGDAAWTGLRRRRSIGAQKNGGTGEIPVPPL